MKEAREALILILECCFLKIFNEEVPYVNAQYFFLRRSFIYLSRALCISSCPAGCSDATAEKSGLQVTHFPFCSKMLKLGLNAWQQLA